MFNPQKEVGFSLRIIIYYFPGLGTVWVIQASSSAPEAAVWIQVTLLHFYRTDRRTVSQSVISWFIFIEIAWPFYSIIAVSLDFRYCCCCCCQRYIIAHFPWLSRRGLHSPSYNLSGLSSSIYLPVFQDNRDLLAFYSVLIFSLTSSLKARTYVRVGTPY